MPSGGAPDACAPSAAPQPRRRPFTELTGGSSRMPRRSIQIALLAVVLIGAAVLRLYELKDIPAGLFCDEAAFGYNGYTIGSSGYDENGKFLPLLVWSFAG